MKSVRLFEFAALILVVVADLSAQVPNQVLGGARPLALGETFVAIADDGNAIYWNPAGLPLIENYGLYGMHANLYNSGVRSNYLSFFLPFSEHLAFGVDWFNIGINDNELEYFDHKFNLALGYKISERLSLGMNLKHLRFEGDYLNPQSAPFSDARANGFGADLGLLYRLSNRFRLGVMAHDVTDTRVKHNHTGVKEVIQRRHVRYGAAFGLRKNWLIAADVDDRAHLGSEFKPANLVTLRAGLQKDRHTDEGLTYAFGAGIDVKLLRQTLRLDYAYTVPPSLPDMSTFSMSILFDLFSRLVKIEKVNISPIYASLYKHHSQDSIGTAVIRYKGKEKLNYKISASIPQYSRPNPKEFFIEPRLAPRASRDNGKPGKTVAEAVETVSLYAFLTDSILMVEGNTPLTARVTVSYLVNRKIRTTEATQEIKLFPRNRLNWAAGVEQVAAFIDNEDNDIETAANDFLARVPAEILINSNINRAQKLFEGLGLVGITYKEDPYEAYTQVYAGLDKVLYPYQLLKEKRTGDCDDLTVLYAALLENCNIPAALISAPGHIFLMLDSDIPERQHEMLRLPSSMYHISDGTVWIPVEITEVGKSFDVAWEKGAQNFQTYAAAGDTEIVKVRTAWEKYEAVKYPRNLKRVTPQIRYAATGNFVRQIRQRQEEYMNGLRQQLAQDPVEARQKLSRAHALQGEYDEAEKYLREIIVVDAKNFVAFNNLGNVYFLQGRLDSAAASYAKALPLARTADDSLGIRLNFGALYHAEKDDTLAAEMIAEALRGGNDLRRVERLLGLKFNEIDMGKAGAEQSLGVSAFSMKKLVMAASQSKQKKKGQKPKKDKTKSAGQKGAPLSRDEIENVFFWAQ